MKPRQRSKTLGARLCLRLTDNEAERVATTASEARLTVSEWSRRAVMDALECPPWARLMLGEFLAMRSVLVDLHNDLIQGIPPSNDRLKTILQVADSRKFAQADGRLSALTITSRETSEQ